MRLWAAALLMVLVGHPLLLAGERMPPELRVKPEQVFEFSTKPSVIRSKGEFVISFASKGFCDVTVAIENSSGKILRHLVSGVLGANAPAPLAKKSKQQKVIWDGKDDQGRYIDDLGDVVVRVSLGLKPRLERTLYWSPHKRYGSMPLLAAGPEGMYVFDGKGVDFLRLFDHDGEYLRTVYPFPRDKVKKVSGIKHYDFPQGYRLPVKGGIYQDTLLTSGPNWHSKNHSVARHSNAGSAMALRGKRLALAHIEVNRLSTDGSSGGLKLRGAHTGYKVKSVAGGMPVNIGPSSIAFSPDGKTLYTTGYLWRTGSWRRVPGCYHAVFKSNYESNDPPKIFLGDLKKHGQDARHFRVPTSVATDAQGRVYVTDFLNNRVQVYSSAGKPLKTLKTPKPAKVCLHRKTGEIYVFSYPVVGVPYELYKKYTYAPKDIKQTLVRFSAMPQGKKLSSEPFPLGTADSSGFEATGHVYHVELDSWATTPTVWVVGRKHAARGAEFSFSGHYSKNDLDPRLWQAGIRIQKRVKGKWQVTYSFGQKCTKDVLRASPPKHNVQRLIVNPRNGRLYVAEPDSGPTIKASKSWLEIRPRSGRIKEIKLPFNAMEGAFDLNGLVYLRNTDYIARYTFPVFREVPWDYGEEKAKLGNDGSINGRSTSAISALKMPTTSPVCYHQGGIAVSASGKVIASCAYRYVGISSGRLSTKKTKAKDVYKPALYPGRITNSTSPCIHVWDKHGQLLHEDAVPGVGQCDGVGIDRDDNIYVMQAPSRFYNGKRYFNNMSQTLMKVLPGKNKVISSGRAPMKLTQAGKPARSPDLWSTRHGQAWVQGAQWLYGGVGFAGFNMIGSGGGCACWFSRFTLDYFARSIAPEPLQFRVAVLDSAGNLILRIGRYGNVQDGKPLISKGGPAVTRSIGGDEVSLVHACFVGTHTDRRIFISDLGNARILSVKLDYHATEKIQLKKIITDGLKPGEKN
jgi:DNA-binding beta-propeller fold protein YncE